MVLSRKMQENKKKSLYLWSAYLAGYVNSVVSLEGIHDGVE